MFLFVCVFVDWFLCAGVFFLLMFLWVGVFCVFVSCVCAGVYVSWWFLSPGVFICWCFSVLVCSWLVTLVAGVLAGVLVGWCFCGQLFFYAVVFVGWCFCLLVFVGWCLCLLVFLSAGVFCLHNFFLTLFLLGTAFARRCFYLALLLFDIAVFFT